MPDSFRPKARHALKTLLRPLGLAPEWIPPDELSGRALYYGPADPQVAGVRLLCSPESAAYFADRRPYDVKMLRWHRWRRRNWPVLFGEETPDLIASAFFWLSGWQEVVSDERDEHGRFPHAASLQARLGTTTCPLVDVYREIIAERLEAGGIVLRRRRWNGRGWAFCPTHDVDYLRKWRPGILFREFVQNLALNRRRARPAERLRRLQLVVKDLLRPGDPYRRALVRMQEEVEAHGGTATYFIKTAARDEHDVPYNSDGAYMRRRLGALLESGFEIGLHPSYPAVDQRDLLEEEADRLRSVIGDSPRSVRQHYLRYDHRITPRLHDELGFLVDSTLGFAEHEGFRHATCHPFQLYDFESDRPFGVWELPLALMESTLFNRRRLSPDEARKVTDRLMRTCRRFGGAAVMLWHNTLWDELDCPGWGTHFTETLAAARAADAWIASLESALRGWD